MKTHWNDKTHGAPPGVQKIIENKLAQHRVSTGERITDAMTIAFGAGFDFAEPGLPALEELERLQRANDPQWRIFERDNGVEIEAQRRARQLWLRYREWAKGEPAHVLAERAAAEREARDRAAAIERRALDILATQERARLDTAHRRAVLAAEKELEQ